MPLLPGKENIGKNISELTHHGSRPRSRDQIIAIAMANARRHPNSRNARADGGPSDFDERRRLAKRAWEANAPEDEQRDDTYALIEASQKLRKELFDLRNPSYAEGEILPRTPRQQHGEDVYQQERDARGDAPGREDDLAKALALRDFGYYGPSDPRAGPGAVAPTPENQRRKELGEPISFSASFAAGGDVERALSIAHRATGGMASGGGASSGQSPYGFTVGTGAGRHDKNDVTLGSGSYVLPADVVAGLGEGNSMAGADVWNKILSTMPYGVTAPKLGGRKAPPSPPSYGYLAQGVTGSAKDQESALSAMTKEHAAGGSADGVPIRSADGEILISPDDVLRVGMYYGPPKEQGNHKALMRRGHKVLDSFVKHVRGKTIRHLKKLKGPVGSENASKGHL